MSGGGEDQSSKLNVNGLRLLTNPEQRAEIPQYLDYVHNDNTPLPVMMRIMETGLNHHGASFKTVQRINIAYPHKHPVLFPDGNLNAYLKAHNLQERLGVYAPNVEFKLVHAICDMIHLDRSGDQSCAHALRDRQSYEIYVPDEMYRVPFVDANQQGTEFFILSDSWTEQGTTMANLMSYIEHNGGKVIALFSDQKVPFAQEKTGVSTLAGVFNDRSRNTGRLQQLGNTIVSVVGNPGRTAQDYLEVFDAALGRNGNSLLALTNGECNRIIGTLTGAYQKYQSYYDLVLELTDPDAALKYQNDQARKRGRSRVYGA